jgi:hypothetical protein
VLIPTVQQGNLLIAVAGTNGSSTTWTTPTGWNAGANSGTSNTQGLNWWWKVASGTESGTYVTLKASAYEDGGAAVLAYSGTSATSPIVAVGTRTKSDNSGVGNVKSVPFSSVSWSGATNVVSLLLMSWQPNGTTTYWPANYTLRLGATDSFDYVRTAVNLLSQSVSSLPSQTVTLSTGEDVVQSLQVAVRVGP